VHIGKAYVELMRRLGYTHFAAQGGDWGGIVLTRWLAVAPTRRPPCRRHRS
jgi:hypothetical protein